MQNVNIKNQSDSLTCLPAGRNVKCLELGGWGIFNFALLFSILIFQFYTTPVFASDYTVTPVVIDEKVQARDILKESVTITNTTSRMVTLYPTVDNIVGGEAGGIQAFRDPSDADKTSSLANWIEIPRGAIDLKPGEQKIIVFSINVNPGAQPGEYHARITFPGGTTRDEAEALVDESPAVLVNVEVTERMVELLQLKKFISQKSLLFSLPGNLTYIIENAGTKDIAPQGDIIISDRSGKEVASIPVNVEGRKIQPGGVAEFTASIPDSSLLGKYKAFLNVQYGDTRRASIHDSVFFTVIPWKNVAAGIAVISVVVTGFVLLIKRRHTHEPTLASSQLPVEIYAIQAKASMPKQVNFTTAPAQNISATPVKPALPVVQAPEPLQIPPRVHHRHVMDLRQFKR